MVALSPLAYFLQTIPPTPALLVEDTKKTSTNDKTNPTYDEEDKMKQTTVVENAIEIEDEKDLKHRPFEDISAPDIKTALKEAFTNPTFIFITLGFSVCGFHIAFLSTHFPAYLVSKFGIFMISYLTSNYAARQQY
jgi:hypothetical protein